MIFPSIFSEILKFLFEDEDEDDSFDKDLKRFLGLALMLLGGLVVISIMDYVFEIIGYVPRNILILLLIPMTVVLGAMIHYGRDSKEEEIKDEH